MDIAILTPYRGAGIGTRLVRELQTEATELGRPLRLQVVKTNPASRLYHRLGFLVRGKSDLYLEMEWVPPGLRRS